MFKGVILLLNNFNKHVLQRACPQGNVVFSKSNCV